ncbi:MAG: ABC transporter substrate-binding protein, partial [Myxococcales bacterium]|nr:ABC transporter substrate-binding protein [Myxococcales bacterium]
DAGIEVEEELRAMAIRAEQTQVTDLRAIGAILPLSGRTQAIGQNALRGIMLAAGLPSPTPSKDGQFQVFLRDSGGDPAKAAQAVDELVSLHRVVAIVGPLSSEETAAASARAMELGVPLLALSPSVPTGNPWVTRMLPTLDDEVASLTAEIFRRKLQRIAILRPDNAFGLAFEARVRAALPHLPKEAVQGLHYAEDAKSFGSLLEPLGKNPPDALLIGDVASRVTLIAPALAAAGLWPEGNPNVPKGGRTIPWLLPSVAYDRSTLSLGGRYAEGALFAVPFDPNQQTGDSNAVGFATKYLDRFGHSPDVFSEASHRAFHLVREAVEGGAPSRARVAETIRTRPENTDGTRRIPLMPFQP